MVKKEEALTNGRYGNGKDLVEEEAGKEDIYCGVGQFRPRFMQRCASIGCLTAALCLAGISTSTLSIYISSQITMLERQFGFSSSVSGLLLSCNDFGYLLTTLIMSYLARRVHIPRALSLSTLLFGISGLLCTIPFFATRGDIPPISELTFGGNGSTTAAGGHGMFDGLLCKTVESSTLLGQDPSAMVKGGNVSGFPDKGDNSCASEGGQRRSAMSEDYKGLAIVFIALGMIFQGFGKSPRHPFIGTYIDDNVPKTKTTFYLGIISSASIFGPVLAFTLGGLFSQIYLTLEETNMSLMDPRWVGAWWLGFLLFGLMGVVAALPTCFFPRRLKPQPHLRRLEQERKRAAKKGKLLHDIKEFFETILRLCQTPVYMCVLLGGCVSLFGISGMISFMPKYLETQFMIPTWKANIILGVLNVLSASGGVLLGGIVTSRFKLSPKTCLKLMVIASLVSSAFVTTGFFLGCEQPNINMGHSVGETNGQNLTDSVTCQATCHCDATRFFPTCGANGVTYFSPCHAGCNESQGMGYSSCSCVNTTMTSSSNNSIIDQVPEARPGFCDSDCSTLYPYAIMNFFGAFASTLVIMPTFVVSVRSVTEADKPLAIGLGAFMATLLGWFLGPVVYGRIIDTCCMLWSSGCSGSGSCTLYDLTAFRYRYHATFLSSRLACCAFYALALLIASVGNVRFSQHGDDDVMEPTLQPEGEKLVLSENGTVEKTNCKEDEERFIGGRNIYKGKNPA